MQFLYQNVLYLMLVPIIILIFLIASNKSKFEQVFNEEIISKLSIKNKYLTKSSRNILLFIALILMTIALARPVINPKEQNITQEVIPLVIAIDVSKSMLAQDIYPNRLEMAKNKIIELINKPNNLAIGITIFAKSSFVLSPLTYDFTSLKFIINNFDYKLNIDDGSNILDVLEASNKLLKDSPSKNIILLSDGGNKKDYNKEIEFANKNNITVYTLALATNKPTPIPSANNSYLTNKNGEIVTVSLNEAIKELSLKTKGGYINYTLNNSDINSIIADILSNSSKINQESQKYKIYTELFYYPLGLAIFILLLAFSSVPKLKFFSFFALTIFLTNDKSYASILDFKTIDEANIAYKNKEYEKASNSFSNFLEKNEGKYNYGNALYKQGKYKDALKNFSDIETTNDDLEFKKLHNMGNSYVKLNDLENAKKMYEKALKIKNDKETKENLDLINKELDKKKNKESSKNKENQKSNDEKNSNEKNKKDDNQKENSDNQKENQQNSENRNNQDNKEEKSENKENKDKSINENIISNKEEKKWMELLENGKAPILLRKNNGKEENQDNLVSPW